MKTKFIICDNTENTGKPYITENFKNTGCLENAWAFSTEEEAISVIKNCSWEDWAYVQEF